MEKSKGLLGGGVGSLMLLALIVVSITAALIMGKDVNWDQLNYHFYAGFSADGARLGLDLFPASLQSYLNPYSYYPFYWMVSQKLSPQLIVALLAAFHSLNLLLVFVLARRLAPLQGGWASLLASLAALLALFNPVFLQELGSSFSDISISVLVLGGWLLLLDQGLKGRGWYIFWGAFLLGAATGLKLTSGIFVASSLVFVFFLPGESWRKCQAALLYGVASLIGFVCVDGVWAWQLYKAFGNPFFPVLNSIFKSDALTLEPLKDYRFVPDSAWEFLVRPFKMALPLRMVHTEPPAPDLRYVLLIVLGGVGLLVGRGKEPAPQGRSYYALLSVALLSLLLWLWLSGNSRYCLPLAGLCAVVVVLGCCRVFLTRPRFVLYVIGLLLLVQGGMVFYGGQPRWSKQEWGDVWYDVNVPESMRQEKSLYISMDVQSASFLLPSLPAGSALMSVTGQNAILPGSPGGARAEALIARSASLRTLTPVGAGPMRHGSSAELRAEQLLGFGLRVDSQQCDYIWVKGLEMSSLRVMGRYRSADSEQYFESCRLVPATVDAMADFQRRNELANKIFAKAELQCPKLFQPAGMANSNRGAIIGRYYLNTGMQLYLTPSGVLKYINMPLGGDAIIVGTASDWLAAEHALDCSKTFAAPFGGLFKDL